MRAIRVSQPGGPEAMVVEDVAVPTPGPGEALVKVAAGGVNFIDLYVREGRYGNVPPFTPGQEAAGTVVAVAEGVSEVEVGDRVAWCSVLGTYAEYALAPAERLVPVPDGVALEQAAAAMLQGMTAHYLSRSAYEIREGDEVLIHAGAGGTGLLLTQMAKSRGARVLTTVSTPEKARLSRATGADETIDYASADFASAVLGLTEGRGVAVVYDSVGRATFEGSLACLRTRGTAVLFGTASGDVPPFDLERLAPLGSLFVTRPILKHYVAERSELLRRASEVFGMIRDGQLAVRVDRAYALSQAADAHVDLAGRRAKGKLLIVP